MGKISYLSPCPSGIGRVTGYPWVQHYKHIAEGRACRVHCAEGRRTVGGRRPRGGGRAAVCVGAVAGWRSASGAPGGGRAAVCISPRPSGAGRAACGVERAEGGVRVRPATRVGDWGDREE
jgi:hypothetical protein